MRSIVKEVSFTRKLSWAWPETDERLLQAFDTVDDIEYIMTFVDAHRVCVQAGGACGVWPYRLSQLFAVVYTFEPEEENLACLMENTWGIENIKVSDLALWDTSNKGVMQKTESNNAGTGYFKPGAGDISTTTIDDLGLAFCDLIQLDIEGGELQALKGGKGTIETYRPVIVIEEKSLPQTGRDYKLPRQYLESIGYKLVGMIHNDRVFKWS